nr:MAG TPA: 80S ribosome protein [Caudoviricetes sp.]
MYRIMQSALYSEEDLAKFLVENIKVECKKE